MPANRFEVRCIGCGRSFSHVFMPFCDECGNITDAFYDIESVQIRNSTNPYVRFQDLLPVYDVNFLPRTSEYTPVIHAKRIGAKLGMPWLYFKDETKAPTGTTKDRMAAVSLAYLYECGVRGLCTSSTGNSSTAYADAIGRFPDFFMYLFTAEAFRSRVQYTPSNQIKHFVMRGASFVEAFNYATKFAKQNGFIPEQGFFNLGRREGLKLAWFEAIEQVGRDINWYVQAVSSAIGVYGTYKGAKEMRQLGRIDCLPKLLCVQQKSCAPMAHAWDDDSESIEPRHIVKDPAGIATAILRGDPSSTFPQIRKIVIESRGRIIAVSEEEIREARKMAEDFEEISPCFSAASALAGLIKLVRGGGFPQYETVLVNLTGKDREANLNMQQNETVMVRSGDGWVPENGSSHPLLLF